ADPRPALAAADFAAGRHATGRRRGWRRLRGRRRIVDVLDALGIRAAEALELRFDPVDGGPVAIGALPPIAKPRQPFDRCFVLLYIKPSDQAPDGIVGFVVRRLTWRLRGR